MSGRSGLPPAPAVLRRAAAPASPVVSTSPAAPGSPATSASTGRVALTLRLPVFVAANALLGVAAHAVAGAGLPAAGPLAAGLLVVAGAGLLHRRREARFESLAALLLVAQASLHVVLCLGGAGHHTAASLYPGRTMLLAHLLAAGVTGWWLARGEAAAWAAARRVLVRVLLPRLPALPARTAPAPAPEPVRLRPQRPGSLAPALRGPPRAAATA